MSKSAKERFDLNLSRIDELLAVYEKIKTPDPKGYQRDVLRAAIVSAHATLEDLVRGVFSMRLAKDIGVHLHSGNGGEQEVAKKIRAGLDKLGKRLGEVYEFLRQGDSDLPELTPLEAMIERRNNVVHRGDRDANGDLTPIDPEVVRCWADALKDFGGRLLNPKAKKAEEARASSA